MSNERLLFASLLLIRLLAVAFRMINQQGYLLFDRYRRSRCLTAEFCFLMSLPRHLTPLFSGQYSIKHKPSVLHRYSPTQESSHKMYHMDFPEYRLNGCVWRTLLDVTNILFWRRYLRTGTRSINRVKTEPWGLEPWWSNSSEFLLVLTDPTETYNFLLLDERVTNSWPITQT